MKTKRAKRIGSARRSGFVIFFARIIVPVLLLIPYLFQPFEDDDENEEDFSNA